MTSDLGSPRIRRTVEAVPEGRDYIHRARRRDPLDSLKLTPAQRTAAIRWRLAASHVASGGVRPPRGTQTPAESDIAPSGQLWAQERAMRDSATYRIGRAAFGPVAGIAHQVLVLEVPCHRLDRLARRRIGTTAAMISAGLFRVARAFAVL